MAWCLVISPAPLNYLIGCHQVDETVDWLSDYFLRSRLSKPELRSFGLYSSWAPYISEVVSLWEHLIGCLISVQLSNCARESVGSSKIMKGKCQMPACHHLHKLAILYQLFIVVQKHEGIDSISQLCRTYTVRLWSFSSHGSFLWAQTMAGKYGVPSAFQQLFIFDGRDLLLVSQVWKKTPEQAAR